MNRKFKRIFKRGSVTYYYSSIFFPKKIRDDVFTLYAFVRTADDYVDTVPQDIKGFEKFYRETTSAKSSNEIIVAFLSLAKRRKFKREWYIAFLNTMYSDTKQIKYKTFHDLEKYMYGSAEVIGLMMARIMELPDDSLPYAKTLGKAMQLINFIRDIEEDKELGRNYLAYAKTISGEIKRYKRLQKDAETGYRYIPKRYLIPIKTAADMYMWTAQQIEKNPDIVYTKKVKPGPVRVVMRLLYNAIIL